MTTMRFGNLLDLFAFSLFVLFLTKIASIASETEDDDSEYLDHFFIHERFIEETKQVVVTLNHFGHYEDLHAGDGNEPEREYPENNEGQIDRCFRLPMDFTLIERKLSETYRDEADLDEVKFRFHYWCHVESPSQKQLLVSLRLMMNGQKYHALTRKMNETNFILEPLHVFATAPVITELGAKFHLEEEFVAFAKYYFEGKDEL